jgi:GT2 family glycosyltransferase
VTITAIIPTYCRYPYLHDVLLDLAAQSRPIDEVIVIDQTPPSQRPEAFYEIFSDVLPLKVLYLKEARGTCVSRNLAIDQALGDYLLFLDDDLRFEPDYLAAYEEIARTGYDVIHGGVRHRDNELFRSRLFFDDPVQQLISSPNTNKIAGTIGVASGNSLVLRSWVKRIEGFDLQFDNGMCDDWDFGFRLFRAGARIVYRPEPAVRHLKASAGGRRDMFLHGWGRWLGSFRDYTPAWLAPRFYFYGRYFNRTATRRLCFMKLREIFSWKYRLIRYPWGVPISICWWFLGIRRAKQMLRRGPLTLGQYPPPLCEGWTNRLWSQKYAGPPRMPVASGTT